MRPEVGRLDALLRALIEKASLAASRSLSSIVLRTEFVAGQSRAVLDAEALAWVFNRAFSAAVNSRGAEIAANAQALHAVIGEIPARIKAVETLIATVEKAATELQSHFPTSTAEAA